MKNNITVPGNYNAVRIRIYSRFQIGKRMIRCRLNSARMLKPSCCVVSWWWMDVGECWLVPSAEGIEGRPDRWTAIKYGHVGWLVEEPGSVK